jgi:hypothetical protein
MKTKTWIAVSHSVVFYSYRRRYDQDLNEDL